MIRKRDFQRRVDRFRSGVAEEYAVKALRRNGHQFFGRLECRRVVHLKTGRVIDGFGLLLDRIDDRAATVAGVDGPQAGDAVENLAPIVGLVMHVLGRHQQTRRSLELPVCGEGNPQWIEIQRGIQMMQSFFVWHVHDLLLGGEPRNGPRKSFDLGIYYSAVWRMLSSTDLPWLVSIAYPSLPGAAAGSFRKRRVKTIPPGTAYGSELHE